MDPSGVQLNTRDGIDCYHAVADAAREHCIEMGNADAHSDRRYVQILKLYSSVFLPSEMRLVDDTETNRGRS